MLCPVCNQSLAEDAEFCHHCGSPVRKDPGSISEALAPPGDTSSVDKATASERFQQAVRDRQDSDDEAETELWSGNYSQKAMFGMWALGGVLSLAGIILCFFIQPWGWVLLAIFVMWILMYSTLLYRQLSVAYRLTNQRFIHKRGLLSRTTDRIEVIDMDDITFTQGPVERMLGVGTIKVTSSDLTHPSITLPGIDEVERVASMMDDARRKERRKRGLHIESV